MEELLSLVADSSQSDSWMDSAWKWWAVIIVAATVVAGVMLLVKFILKNTSRLKTWSRVTAYIFIFIGFFPILGFTCLWFFLIEEEDPFRNVIQPSGLVIGTVISWGLYLILMLVGHLGRWRRDLF